MEEGKDFETLKKDLEDKSQQIQSLRAEIVCQKQSENITSIGDFNLESMPQNTIHVSPPRLPTSDFLLKKYSPSSQPMGAFHPGIQDFSGQPLPNGTSVESIMKNYQQHIENLQRKLRITTDMCTEQEINYKNGFKDLELKFRRMLSQRDEFIKLRESESNNQQQLINHLQVALEKFEKDKLSTETVITELNKNSNEKQDEVESLSQELTLFKKNFKSISVVLLPDFRKLANESIEDFSELTINSVATVLEKVLLLHIKHEEMLRFQIQSLENQIKDHDKVSDERLNYEKKFVEIQHQGQKNNYVSSIEAKDKEIISLNAKLRGLESKLQNMQKKFKEEIIRYKANMEEKKKNTDMKYQRIYDEKEKHLLGLTKLRTEFNATAKSNESLKIEVEILKQNFNKDNKNISENAHKLVHIERENVELKQQVRDMKEAHQQNKIQAKMAFDGLEKKLKEKEHEIKNVHENEQNLKERLETLKSEVENTVREEEKLIYENKIEEINKVIEKHKAVLENANLDLERKNHIVNTNQNKINDLQNEVSDLQLQTHNLKQNNNQLKSTVAQRDSRIIDLQLKMSHAKDKLKYSGEEQTNRSKALESAQKMNIDFQEKIKIYGREKEDLRQSYEILKQQYTSLQQELNKLLGAMSEKNLEIGNIKKERKAVARKLKEKNDAVILKQRKIDQASVQIKELHQSNAKIHKLCEDLMNKNSSLSKNINVIEEEKKTFEQLLSEKEDIKDKEISGLLSRLQGSEADIMKLKKVLKRYKMSDSSGVKMASITQKVVTKQRTEVDNFKTKVGWMKEALEVSEKTRLELQKDVNKKDEFIGQLHENLFQQEETNQQLSVNLTLCKQETFELHKALEQAAVKYSDVYALVERQEECLVKERRNAQWLLQSQNKRESNMLFKDDFEEIHDKGKAVTGASAPTMELKNLLEDVKELLSSTVKKQSNNNSAVSRGSSQTEVRPTDKNSTVQPNVSHNEAPSTEKIIFIEPTIRKNTQKLNDYLTKHSFEGVNTSSLLFSMERISGPINSTPKQQSPKEDLKNTASSVYSNVNYTTDGDNDDVTLKSQTSDSLFEVTDKETFKNSVNKGSGINSATRLQEKLNNLKKMGEDLTTNNKEINDMMKKHSKKLRKLTIQE